MVVLEQNRDIHAVKCDITKVVEEEILKSKPLQKLTSWHKLSDSIFS